MLAYPELDDVLGLTDIAQLGNVEALRGPEPSLGKAGTQVRAIAVRTKLAEKDRDRQLINWMGDASWVS